MMTIREDRKNIKFWSIERIEVAKKVDNKKSDKNKDKKDKNDKKKQPKNEWQKNPRYKNFFKNVNSDFQKEK